MKIYQIILVAIVLTGKIFAQTPCSSVKISGILYYENAQNTLLQASIVYLKTISGTITDSCTTDNNGYFHFCNVPSGYYHLACKINYPWGGVNAADALLALKHFTEVLPLSGLKLKASDVNVSSHTNSTDAFLIAKRFSQLISTFQDGDWISEHQIISVSDTNAQTLNLKVLCKGDLDGSYVPFIQSFVICGDTLTDQRDFQKYPTVQIGTQCWMKKNLNVGNMAYSNYINGLPHSDCADNGIIEKYCFNNDPALCMEYGGLYDWNELMQYDTTPGIQGLCPQGWHIPTDAEWCTMTTYLDPTVNCIGFSIYTGTNIGGLLRESGTTHWLAPNAGANNQSGFTAIGAGNRTPKGQFGSLKIGGSLYSSSRDSNSPLRWGISYDVLMTSRNRNQSEIALPVRCIKD